MLKYITFLVAVFAALAAGCSAKPGSASSSDPKERAAALQQLALRADEKAVAEVAPLARDEDARTAVQAITALGRMPSGHATEALRQVLTAEARLELRKAAAISLGQRDDPAAAEALRQAVVGDRAPEVRVEAALGLGRSGTPDDINLLANAIRDEKDDRVTRSEVSAMGTICGVKFAYDAKAPPQERQAALERVRAAAAEVANLRKGVIPPQAQCKDPK